jgi:lysine-N-methylase
MAILHPVNNHSVVSPAYVGRFACTGSKCEDNCCTGWLVTIDKKTFNAYRQAKNPGLEKRFSQDVKRIRSQSSNAQYARIELNKETHECPFLEDRLCAIHRDLGENYLCNTCANYPRTTRNYGGRFEQVLTLSCPEAARKALLAPDAFDFVTESVGVRADSIETVKPIHGLALDAMNEVRLFCMQVMRSENIELWQRLAVIGVFCESLTKALTSGGHAGVPAMLETFRTMVQDGQVSNALADMQTDYASHAQNFGILFLRKTTGHVSASQAKVLDAVATGLGIDPELREVGLTELVENYVRGITRLPDALQAAPKLLEHYLLNEMFSEMFPFKGASPSKHFLNLVTRFGLLRLMLAAQCNTADALPDAATLAQTVQVFCRAYQHDTSFAQRVDSVQELFGGGKLDQVFKLLRV